MSADICSSQRHMAGTCPGCITFKMAIYLQSLNQFFPVQLIWTLEQFIAAVPARVSQAQLQLHFDKPIAGN